MGDDSGFSLAPGEGRLEACGTYSGLPSEKFKNWIKEGRISFEGSLFDYSGYLCSFLDMNLFENIPERAPEEVFTELLKADGVRVERIVSFGQASPEGFWYDQKEGEWVLLVEGSATLEFEEGAPVDLKAGDYLNIPAGRRHRVKKTDLNGRTVWLAVFYPSLSKI